MGIRDMNDGKCDYSDEEETAPTKTVGDIRRKEVKDEDKKKSLPNS